MPRSPRKPFVTLPANGTRQVYFILSMIVYLLDIINPNHSFVTRFKDLLNRYPSIDVRAMGFPPEIRIFLFPVESKLLGNPNFFH